MKAGVEVRDVAERVLVDEDVSRMQHDRAIRPRVYPQGGWRRHEAAHFLWPELVLDVVHAQARVLVCGEDQLLADEGARPIFVDVVRPEMTADLEIVLVRGRRES